MWAVLLAPFVHLGLGQFPCIILSEISVEGTRENELNVLGALRFGLSEGKQGVKILSALMS